MAVQSSVFSSREGSEGALLRPGGAGASVRPCVRVGLLEGARRRRQTKQNAPRRCGVIRHQSVPACPGTALPRQLGAQDHLYSTTFSTLNERSSLSLRVGVTQPPLSFSFSVRRHMHASHPLRVLRHILSFDFDDQQTHTHRQTDRLTCGVMDSWLDCSSPWNKSAMQLVTPVENFTTSEVNVQ